MDIYDTILSQYSNSPRLCAIIESFSQAVDPEAFLNLWYDQVWNPATATGWGLDVWGRIVGVGRVLQLAAPGYIGFQEASSSGTSDAVRNFGTGVWFNGQAATSNYALTDDAYRRLIFAKAAANITDGSVTSLNAIVMTLFGDKGRCYVADNLDMSLTYSFGFEPTSVDLAIIYRSGVLPCPAGVRYQYAFVPAEVVDNDFAGDIS
ncbi:DUF2612 domain-containing protein [Asaia krungthepensis]|uniref:DUF2612 domain-containing protein n=1 Tax=Asaia krungthepensis NRIC 0535 TaxID=1307925 RepID=A0ABQ0Q2Z0_9PROT|nr:DUF2612 domain-containing protein [Asaia krungthepensis]GBQ88901.1 hypothetical protein AA0535_1656 [Asaia krungthepensis NRIC 0535]